MTSLFGLPVSESVAVTSSKLVPVIKHLEVTDTHLSPYINSDDINIIQMTNGPVAHLRHLFGASLW